MRFVAMLAVYFVVLLAIELVIFGSAKWFVAAGAAAFCTMMTGTLWAARIHIRR